MHFYLLNRRTIVTENDAEQALLNTKDEPSCRVEAKIKTAIDRVWGSEGT